MSNGKARKAAAASRKSTKTEPKKPDERRWKIDQEDMNAYIDLKAKGEAEMAELATKVQARMDQAMGDMRINAGVPDMEDGKPVQVGIRGSFFFEVKEE
jgi:hypothetical protein